MGKVERGRRRVKVADKNFPSTGYTVVNHMKSIYVRLPRLIRYTESLMHQRVRKGIKVCYVDVPCYFGAFDNVVTRWLPISDSMNKTELRVGAQQLSPNRNSISKFKDRIIEIV